MIGRSAAILTYYGLRMASALLLLKLAALYLRVSGFVLFTQFLALSTLLTLAAVCGGQNGLVRQAAVALGPSALARVHGAGLWLWLVAIPLGGGPVAAFRGEISRLLTGSDSHGLAVVGVLALALLAAPGQIWCSLLTGRGRTIASLAAQFVGLAVGTGLAARSIVAGQPVEAALAFAGGGLVTMAVSAPFAHSLLAGAGPARPRRSDLRELIGYSGALAAIAAANLAILLGLRLAYRDAFGQVMLGHWMAANRISDLATQLTGLFMMQAFVPRYSAIPDPAERRRFLLRCGLAGTAVMLAPLGLFALAADTLVPLFLSASYVPAIGAIKTYMAGDALRVWTSLAIYAAFASGAPGRYAGIEIGVLALSGGLTLMLIGSGNAAAPQTAYLAVNALAAAAMLAWLAVSARR